MGKPKLSHRIWRQIGWKQVKNTDLMEPDNASSKPAVEWLVLERETSTLNQPYCCDETAVVSMALYKGVF